MNGSNAEPQDWPRISARSSSPAAGAVGRHRRAQFGASRNNLETLGLKTPTKQIRPDRVRSRVALTLLVLVAYASLINGTHHHGQLRQPASDSGISSSEDRNSSRTPASNDPSHCATCRLLRGFNSALRAPSISFDLCPQTLSYETCPREPDLPEVSVVFSSRGPPHSDQPSLKQSGV